MHIDGDHEIAVSILVAEHCQAVRHHVVDDA